MINLSKRREFFLAMMAAPGVLSLSGCAEDSQGMWDYVRAQPDLTILTQAIQAAGLTEAVASSPRTLFAPTDTAFQALLSELGISAQALLSDTALLQSVLAYHLIGQAQTQSSWVSGKAIEPVGGGFFKLVTGNPVTITDGRNRLARSTQLDVPLSNGVLHRIDQVLLPANRTIVATAQATAQTSTLVTAIQAAGLVPTLSAAGPFTVFAPVNSAFDALLIELGITLNALLADTVLLTKVLTYHVVGARVLQADIVPNQGVTSAQGQTFLINAGFQITDARQRAIAITATDTLASNGVIHLVDRVLLPV